MGNTSKKLTSALYLSAPLKTLTIASLFLAIVSCDPHGDPRDIMYTHQLQVENTSNSDIRILAYDTYDEQYRKYLDEPVLKQTISIEANNKGPIAVDKNYSVGIDNSTYFPNVDYDSLVLKFENAKGYYATLLYKNGNEYRELDKENWIPNKSTLLGVFSADVRKEGDVYIYTITQEDYENAHELP